MALRLPGAPLLLLLLLAAVAVGPITAAAAAQPPSPPTARPPTVFLHLSDIHYSTNVHKYLNVFGDREGDAALFTQRLVPRLQLAAAVITGDITDSKTARGDGLQQEAEWLAYASLISNLSAAGVPEARVWDVPGNHDTFNMPRRGGANDFFEKYAAEGRRRVSPTQRIYVHRLPQQDAGIDGDVAAACPAAWMLGIDPTPDPGLRSPTNFAGLAIPALMAQAHEALLSIPKQQPAGCGPPLILAYCHYPLSTIDSAVQTMAGPPGALLHATHSVRAMQGFTQLLAEHNVSAVLSGHLHSSFGQRLHRVHTTRTGGHMAEIETAAWKDDRRFRLVAVDGGAVSFADLMFHTRNTPRMPRRSDAAAMKDPVWQETYTQRGWAVTALDPSAAVIEHIALITWPPDGRYSLLGAPAAQQEQQQEADGWVRALLFPLEATAGADSAGAGQLDVQLAGYLPGGIQLFSSPMQLQQAAGGGSAGSGDGPFLYAAQGETTVSCVASTGGPAAHCLPPAEHVLIQVSVQGPGGVISRSPRQPVALRCSALTTSHQRCWVAPVAGAPLPLGTTFVEWLGLAFHWPVMVHRMFLCLWAFQVFALLLAPRLLASWVVPHIAASPLFQCRSEQQLPATPRGAAAVAGVRAASVQALRAGLAFLLWPLAALFLCATVTEVWGALLGYSLYLLVGPWFLYPALSGQPPAMLFHYGVLGRLDTHGGEHAQQAPAPAGWQFVGTPDTMFASLVHTMLCLLPATLWVACVVARRMQLQHHSLVSRSSSAESSSSASSTGGGRQMEGGGAAASSSPLRRRSGSSSGGSAGFTTSSCGRWSFSGCQLAALVGLAAFNWAAIYHKALLLMGAQSLLLSPGLGWTLPLALLLVSLWGGPRRRCGRAAAKGE